jgi:hypothetical protein
LTQFVFFLKNQSNLILPKTIQEKSTGFLPVLYPKFLIGSGDVNSSSIFFKVDRSKPRVSQVLGQSESGFGSIRQASLGFITTIIIILLISTLDINLY